MTEWIVSSSALICAVMVLRKTLRGKISPRLQYLVWAIVLVRLLCPVSFFESPISIQNVHQQVMVGPQGQQFQQAMTAPIGNMLAGTAQLPQAEISGGEQILIPLPSEPVESEQTPGTQTGTEVPPVSQLTPEAPAHTISLGTVLKLLWLAGVGIFAGGMVVCNLHFYGRLKRSRKKLEIPQCPIDVYVTGAVDTPCLFGMFRPAVYLTPGSVENSVTRRYVLTHELTHYFQFDHVWSLLRAVCLMVHWYNPLVWIAFRASRQDCEMSCDEGTLKRLGEEHRGDYGRTLISLATQTRLRATLVTATSVADGKKAIRERIVILMKKPKTALVTLVSLILIGTLVVGCTFTGAPEKPDTRPATLGELIGEGGYEVFVVEEGETNTTYTSVDTALFDFRESGYLLDWDNARKDGTGLFADSEILIQVHSGDGSRMIQFRNGEDAEWIYIGGEDCYVPLKLNPDALPYDSIEDAMNAKLAEDYDLYLFGAHFISNYGNGTPEEAAEAYRVGQIKAKKRAAHEGLTGNYVYQNVGTRDFTLEISPDGNHLKVSFKLVFIPYEDRDFRCGQMQEGSRELWVDAYLIRKEDGFWRKETIPSWHSTTDEQMKNDASYGAYFSELLVYDGVNHKVDTGLSWEGNSIIVGQTELTVTDSQRNPRYTIPNPDPEIFWTVCDEEWIYGIRGGNELLRMDHKGENLETLFRDGSRTIGENVYLADGGVLFFTANASGSSVVYRLFIPSMTLDIMAQSRGSDLRISRVVSNHEVVWYEPNPGFATFLTELMEDLPEKYQYAGAPVGDLESWISRDYRIPMGYNHYASTATGGVYILPYFGNYYSLRTQENITLNGEAWWKDYQPAEGAYTMSWSQLQTANEAFVYAKDVDGMVQINPLCIFIDQYYTTPWGLNLSAFLKYFTSHGLVDGYDAPVTDAEIQAIEAAYPDFWVGNVSSHHYDEVDQVLRRYFGVKLEELLALSGTNYPYLEEYNRFYVSPSDVGGRQIEWVYGTIRDGVVMLYSRNDVLTLVERDGAYIFWSFQPHNIVFSEPVKTVEGYVGVDQILAKSRGLTVEQSGDIIILSEDGLNLWLNLNSREVLRHGYVVGMMKSVPKIVDGTLYLPEDFYENFLKGDGQRLSLFYGARFFPEEILEALEHPEDSKFNSRLLETVILPPSMGIETPHVDVSRVFNRQKLSNYPEVLRQELENLGYTDVENYTYSEYEVLAGAQTLQQAGISRDTNMTVAEYRKRQQEKAWQNFLLDLSEDEKTFASDRFIEFSDLQILSKYFNYGHRNQTDEVLRQVLEEHYEGDLEYIRSMAG